MWQLQVYYHMQPRVALELARTLSHSLTLSRTISDSQYSRNIQLALRREAEQAQVTWFLIYCQGSSVVHDYKSLRATVTIFHTLDNRHTHTDAIRR